MPIFEPCVILKPEAVTIDPTARIDSFCKLEGGEGLHIGAMVHVASFCHLNGGGGTVILHAHCGLASGVKVIGGQPDLRYLAICPQEPAELRGVIRQTTEIGSYALLATNCVILPGVTVGEGAVVAAGAVVTQDVPAWEVWAGVPAKRIGYRHIDRPYAPEWALADADWVGI